jgi:hypothetical protein
MPAIITPYFDVRMLDALRWFLLTVGVLVQEKLLSLEPSSLPRLGSH